MPFSTETFIVNNRILPPPPPETVKPLPGQITYIPGKTPNPEETVLKLPIVGIGSTTPEFPTKPMIIKVISYEELDEATNIKKPKIIKIGIGSTGIIFREEIEGQSIVANNNVKGDVEGNVSGDINSTGISSFSNVKVGGVSINAGVITATSFEGDVNGSVNGTVTGNLTGDVNAGIVTATSISNGTNFLSFSVSGSDLTLTITGVGSTTLKLA